MVGRSPASSKCLGWGSPSFLWPSPTSLTVKVEVLLLAFRGLSPLF